MKPIKRKGIGLVPAIVSRAEELLPALLPSGSDATEQRKCLYWAAAVMMAGKEHNRKLILQAGSASFLFLKQEEDDGKSPTHFSYMWEGNTRFVHMGGNNISLPEMHIWCADVERKEVVDLTTRFLKEDTLAAGFRWTAADPPRYLWNSKLPKGWAYQPNREATMLAYGLMKRLGFM